MKELAIKLTFQVKTMYLVGYSPSLVANICTLDFALQGFGSKVFHSYYCKEAGDLWIVKLS